MTTTIKFNHCKLNQHWASGDDVDLKIHYADVNITQGPEGVTLVRCLPLSPAERVALDARLLTELGDQLRDDADDGAFLLKLQNPQLRIYLELEDAMQLAEAEDDDPWADVLRDALDPIWRALSDEDREALNARGNIPAPAGPRAPIHNADGTVTVFTARTMKMTLHSRTMDGPANRPATLDEVRDHFRRSYDHCAETPMEDRQLICMGPIGHAGGCVDHLQRLRLDECVWGDRELRDDLKDRRRSTTKPRGPKETR